MTTAARLLAVALDVAARGWPVFPLRPGTKRPALHAVERCPGTGPCTDGHAGWEQRATTDPDRIRRAWTVGPYNVGIPAGRAGLLVVDLDLPDGPDDRPPPGWETATGGADVLGAVAEQVGKTIPDTFTVITPSGGRHLYYLAPAGPGAPELRNTAGDRGRGLGWKIDTRGQGGYVVAAGSTTPGGTYRHTGPDEPAPLPEWLCQRLRPPALPPPPSSSIRTRDGRVSRYLHAAITAETARVHDAPAGQRNFCLYVAAVALGQLVAGGALAEREARGVLLDAAARHLALGAYSPNQADQTITSGLRAGAKRPRSITDGAPAGPGPIGDAA
jgi:hypothetical protein